MTESIPAAGSPTTAALCPSIRPIAQSPTRALVGSVYDIRSGVVDEVQKRIALVTSPECREAIAQKKTREFLFGGGANSGIGRHLAYEERILRFLGR